MSYQMDMIQVSRQKMIQDCAKKSNAATDGNGYANVIDSILSKSQSSTPSATSSNADFKKKIENSGSEKLMKTGSAIQQENLQTMTILCQNLKALKDATQVLLGTQEMSLFLKNKPISEQAAECFDLSCSMDGTEFSLEVKQLAQNQVNKGAELSLQDETTLCIGRKHFDVCFDGKTTPLTIKISEGDTNEIVMNKIISAINSANCGIQAQLDMNAGKGHLVLSSKGTGAPIEGQERVFSFVNQSDEDVVAMYGMNTVFQEGKDAIFNYNHATEDSTYMYNSAKIDGAVNVDFKKVTDGPVDVSFTYNYDAVSDAVQKYVDAFNELSASIAKTTYQGLKNYFNMMSDCNKEMEETISSIGLTTGSAKTLRYNNGMLYKSDMSELTTVLNGGADGYMTKMKDTMDHMEQYLNRISGKTKKYYGLKAKKSNQQLRQLLQ